MIDLIEEYGRNDILHLIKKLKEMISDNGKDEFSSQETNKPSEKGENALKNQNVLEQEPNLNFTEINSVIYNEAIILITDINGVIIYVNNKCCEALGYQTDELIGQPTRIFKTGLHSLPFYQHLWNTVLSGEIWKGEMTAKRKDGSFAWNFLSIFPLFDKKKKIYGFLTMRTDITDKKEMEKCLLLQEKLSEIPSNQAVGCIDHMGKMMYLSPAVKTLLGYGASEGIGLNIYDRIKPGDLSDFKIWMEKLKTDPDRLESREVTLKSKSGAWISCEVTAKNLLNDPIISSIVLIYRDISSQKDLSDEEKKQYFDQFTSLPNYNSFDSYLNDEIAFAKDNNTLLAIVHLDIDDFTSVNSRYGRRVGNQLLIDFSLRIKEAMESNVVMFRHGGDEFIILISGIDNFDDISNTLTKIYSYINMGPFEYNENKLWISASMGVSVFPFSGDNKEILLKNAEMAMVRAKNQGKNQFHIFPPTMNINRYKQFILKNDLEKALFRKEYSIFFQPRYNPMTDEMVSAEALIRWNHPTWGIVSPDEFILLAEKTGLIVQIGEWLFKNVCKQIKMWENENLPLKKISINLSAVQLLQPHFAESVSSILSETHVCSKWIEFEITESIIIKKEGQVLNTLNVLRSLGITIALDDFGTGYSSLNYLRKFPCETIKIDKSLIVDIHNDKDNYEIISSIIDLCHKLKKSVVGEGVETTEQLVLLKDLKCDEIQGYYYSKPVEEQTFRELLKQSKWEKKVSIDFNQENNRRKELRFPLKVPFLADMSIGEIENRGLHIKSSHVFIKNIASEGLCFYSTLRLPVKDTIILEFKIEILYNEVRLKGHIVWRKEVDHVFNRYGVRFLLNEMDQDMLSKILNQLQIELQDNYLLPGCRYEF